ncbi:hypothetical protein [Nonomuraea ceibae]|uniref:hypothetical protein n=1 Tax=Nonomuraea ceibae TaxID=1935170 RepID=UPI001C6019DA|nr:hypothetical protein [Nonomuraea ceibae]
MTYLGEARFWDLIMQEAQMQSLISRLLAHEVDAQREASGDWRSQSQAADHEAHGDIISDVE